MTDVPAEETNATVNAPANTTPDEAAPNGKRPAPVLVPPGRVRPTAAAKRSARPRGEPDWKVQFTGILLRLPSYLKLGWALAKSPDIPRNRKSGLLGGVLYSLSPIDLVPGIIPVLGQLDDIGILLAGLRSALRNCPPETAERLLKENGLSRDRLDRDIRAIGPIAKGFSKSIAKGAWRGTKAVGVALGKAVGHGLAAGAKGLWKAYRGGQT